MVEPLLAPAPEGPLSVIFFASGGPGNLATALALAEQWPKLLSVDLVVVDRLGIPAVNLAHAHGIEILGGDFEARCGSLRDCQGDVAKERLYREKAEQFHAGILDQIRTREVRRARRFDLVVLAYRRVIRGALLSYFEGRMINQHPADLGVLDAKSRTRRYVGIGGHARELRDERGGSRTSTILVRAGVDTGEILGRGPWVPFEGNRDSPADIANHEALQKQLSDRPALSCIMLALARGLLAFGERRHADGGREIRFRGAPLPYAGIECSELLAQELAEDHVQPTPSERIKNHVGHSRRAG